MSYNYETQTAIGRAISGYRLPYSSCSKEQLKDILAHKRNNVAAIIICADGLKDYLSDQNNEIDTELLNELYDEIGKFCSYGVLGIGYFGISVEDGMPKRIDSCGKNMGLLYGSVYETMTREEYENIDRIESMIIDQKDNRRFLQYLRGLELSMIRSMATVFSENDGDDPILLKCMEFDSLFTKVAISVGRSSNNSDYTRSVGSANKISMDLQELIQPYRRLLEDDRVSNLKGYTVTDLKPIRPRKPLI